MLLEFNTLPGKIPALYYFNVVAVFDCLSYIILDMNKKGQIIHVNEDIKEVSTKQKACGFIYCSCWASLKFLTTCRTTTWTEMCNIYQKTESVVEFSISITKRLDFC